MKEPRSNLIARRARCLRHGFEVPWLAEQCSEQDDVHLRTIYRQQKERVQKKRRVSRSEETDVELIQRDKIKSTATARLRGSRIDQLRLVPARDIHRYLRWIYLDKAQRLVARVAHRCLAAWIGALHARWWRIAVIEVVIVQAAAVYAGSSEPMLDR